MKAKHVETAFFNFYSQSLARIVIGHGCGHTGDDIKDKYPFFCFYYFRRPIFCLVFPVKWAKNWWWGAVI